MVQSIEEITVNQGVDPRSAVLIGGGGAAGLNAVAIARRLGAPRIVIPESGAVLSARGALMSDLMTEYAAALITDTERFDRERANTVLEGLEARCLDFAQRSGSPANARIEFIAEARYRHQVWQLDVPLRGARLASDAAIAELVHDFHAIHDEVYAVRDERAVIELVNVRARVICPLAGGAPDTVAVEEEEAAATRTVYFSGAGDVEATIRRLASLAPGTRVEGPAIIESSFTTIVLNPGAGAERQASGSVVVCPGRPLAAAVAAREMSA
jgi:N-methylhydantoinase A